LRTDSFSHTILSRNAGIDLLRGIAILLVVLHHIALRISLKKGVLAEFLPKWFLNAIMFNGYEAVMMFFVISGFLITTNSLSRWGSVDRIVVRDFYVRRAARILPCLLALIAVLSVLHLTGVQDYFISRPGQSLPGAVTSALGLYLNWYEGQTGYLPANWDVLWSLSIEELFYLAFPLVCLTVGRTRLLLPLLIVFGLSLPFTHAAIVGNDIWKEKAYLPGMAAIATGVAGALIAARYRSVGRGAIALLATAGAIGIVVNLFAGSVLWSVLGSGSILLLTLATICLVLAFHWQARTASPWSFRGTAWLRASGQWSYEIYLTHMFVILPVVQVFKASGADMRWGFLWYVPTVVMTCLVGWFVARFFSTPCDQAIRRRFLAHT